MERTLKFLGLAAALGAVAWFLSQMGGEPRFAKIQGTAGEGSGGAVGVPGAPGIGVTGLGAKGAKPPKGQPSGGEMVAPPTGPTLGPPPLSADPGEPSIPDQPVYLADKDLSRFAAKSTVPFTRIHQILVEAGHGDVAKEVSDFQRLLKEVRRGEEPEVESLAAQQEAVVVEVGEVLTGQEVEELLEELQAELTRLQEAEAEKRHLLEREAAKEEP